MEADQFRSALRTKPFRPFTIRTGSGEKYLVKHPETVAISESGRTVVFAFDDGHVVFDMASINEVVVSPSRPKKNAQ